MKKTLNSYKELDVYKKSIILVSSIYQLTRMFPEEEKYGLISQMRRAAVSIPLNIAEGAKRQTTKEFIHFFVCSEWLLF